GNAVKLGLLADKVEDQRDFSGHPGWTVASISGISAPCCGRMATPCSCRQPGRRLSGAVSATVAASPTAPPAAATAPSPVPRQVRPPRAARLAGPPRPPAQNRAALPATPLPRRQLFADQARHQVHLAAEQHRTLDLDDGAD